MEPLSENSLETLRETVFDLVTHNQQFDALIKEISAETELSNNGIGSVSELCCLSLIKSQSLQLGTSTGYHGSDQCASVFSSVIKNAKGPLLSESHKNNVESVLQTLRLLMADGCFEKSRFLSAVLQHNHAPLELVCILAKEGILSIGNYISKKHSRSGLQSDLSSQLKTLIVETEASDTAVHCLAELTAIGKGGKKKIEEFLPLKVNYDSGFLTELIEIMFSDRTQKSDRTAAAMVVTAIIDRAVLDFIDLTFEKPETESLTFIRAFEKLGISIPIMKKASFHFLSLVLSYKPVTKVSQAIQQQANWCYGKASVLLLDWYKQLLLPLTTEDVLEKLQRILDQQEVNWQLLLTFVSTMIVCLPEAQKTFLDFTDKLFQDGLEHSDMESMITGILLVRQACFHGPHVFMSYADWFQRTFSESSRSLATSRKGFTFLLKFLTDIMPYENASHLKVHILRPPFVPPKCRDQLADYVLLAKTRLEDLKETLEISGQEDVRSTDEAKLQEQLYTEVENAAQVFSSSGKIPSSVMEASIFKKPYYVGKFLPALLKPRPLPSVPDSKMKLLEALKKAEKIPPSMYSSYEKACRKETLQLTEGLFLDLDSDDDMELSPLDQLNNYLNQLHQSVQFLCDISAEAPKFNVRECVSNICEKIEGLLNTTAGQQEIQGQYLTLDTDNFGIPPQQLQVVDSLLNHISQAVYTVYSSPSPDFSWLSLLLKGVTQYSCVLKALFMRIWSLVFTQGENLENHHVDSLAAILVEIQSLGDQLPWIQLSSRCSHCSFATRTFTEQVYQMIAVSDVKSAVFTLRLTASYMKYVISSKEKNISATVLPVVIKKLVYTATRFLPEVRYQGSKIDQDTGRTDQFIVAMFRSPFFQETLQNVKFTFSDWLNYEITVDTDQDVLTVLERYEYYTWAVYQHFHPMSVEHGGYAGDFKLAASEVLQVLVTSDCQCEDRQPSCQKCGQKRQTGSSGRNQLISLLQELPRMFTDSGDSNRKEKLPWLPSQLVTLSEKAALGSQQAVVTSFFRISLCLPAHLLFSDPPNSEEEINVGEIAEFIYAFMVEYLTEGIYLPLSLTSYILQGLRLASSEDSFSRYLDSLCEGCPALTLSLLVHHKQLKHILKNEYSLGRMSAIQRAINCYRQQSVPAADPQIDDWLYAAVMFSWAAHNHFSSGAISVLPISRYTEKAFPLFAELLLLHWASLQLSRPHQKSDIERIPTLIRELLGSYSGSAVLSSLLNRGCDELPSHCIGISVLQFRQTAVMRLMVHIPPKSFVQRFGSSLNDLLNLLAEVAFSFDKLSPQENEIQEMQEVMSLDELMGYNSYLKKVIALTPTKTLKNVSQDILLACGSDVVLCVQRRFQGF